MGFPSSAHLHPWWGRAQVPGSLNNLTGQVAKAAAGGFPAVNKMVLETSRVLSAQSFHADCPTIGVLVASLSPPRFSAPSHGHSLLSLVPFRHLPLSPRVTPAVADRKESVETYAYLKLEKP